MKSCVTIGRACAFLAFVICCTNLAVYAKDAPAITEISGVISDASGNPVENAALKAEGTDVSTVLTDSNGRYKFYLVGQKAKFTLRAFKDGYSIYASSPVTPSKIVKHDIILKRDASATVSMDKFVAGSYITGSVLGLSPEEAVKHKVLVYVLTDKWYIHPYAENKARRGYAKIQSDGSWEIQTVNRGHSPFKIAIALVPKAFFPPAAIQLEGDADAALKDKFGRNLKALLVFNAPEGL